MLVICQVLVISCYHDERSTGVCIPVEPLCFPRLSAAADPVPTPELLLGRSYAGPVAKFIQRAKEGGPLCRGDSYCQAIGVWVSGWPERDCVVGK